MAATAISLHFRTKHRRRRRPITSPSFLHFFSSSTPSSDSTNSVDDQNTPSPPPPPPPQSQSSFSSYFSDVKARLKQQQTPSKTASPEEIRKNLAEFSRRYAAPPPANNSSQQQPISFQELYKRRSENSTIEASNKGGGGEGGAVRRPAFDAIRESLRQLNSKKASNNADQVRNNNDPMSLQRYRDMLNMRPVDPNNGRDSTVVIGGTDKQLPVSVFGKELREKKENESVPMRTEFTRRYGYDELGVKLRKLRPEGKKGEWFSLGELNERLMKLRELEEKEMELKMAGVPITDLRRSLMTLHMVDEEKTKKQMSQRLDVLGQLGGTPNFLLSPPKEHLVEKYFHPDHMSSSEKMKLELQKVRDEFKMSESDCGSARVQVAQLTTKIKHLSTALHKKDKHSRKGLQAMVQRRKKLLKYLRTTDWDSYCLVLSKLGLRDNPDFKILTYPRKST